MADTGFDLDAWCRRLGYDGPRAPTLETLRAVTAAHADAIAYESIDVLLDRAPKLDLQSLQRKMISDRRGGYCFEQNMLFRGALIALGFDITSLQARVVRGLAVDAARPALHMVLRVNLPEGAFLADVGFGNLAPTAPLALIPDLEQQTPHEIMRLVAMGDELLLQSKLGQTWEHIYRVVSLPRMDAEYEICNWFTASHPDSPYRSNLIAARPGPNRTRITLFNARLTIRHPDGTAERRTLDGTDAFREALAQHFGLTLPEADLEQALDTMARKGSKTGPHPFFA